MSTYSKDRIVTVASVRLTEEESALIIAYARLAGTKVEAIASDLTRHFIDHHVRPHVSLIETITDNETKEAAVEFTKEHTNNIL